MPKYIVCPLITAHRLLSRGRRRDFWGKLEQLRAWEKLDAARLKDLQSKRLGVLLHHAYTTTAYYRDLFDSLSLVQNGSIDIEEFSRVPFLTKEILRTRRNDLIACVPRYVKTHWDASGGSTGEPVRFLLDDEFTEWEHAVRLWFDGWAGRAIGDRTVSLWGSERELLRSTVGAKRKLMNVLFNIRFLNAFRMTPEDMQRFVQVINTFKPVFIVAYAENIYELARYVEREGLTIHTPRSIMTSATTLYSHMRKTLERVFQCSLFDRYGSREFGGIACECNHHKGLHISALTHYVEIIRHDGTPAHPGEVGEIVITSLINYSMPLIRYRTGDMGIFAKEPCTCGRQLPLLKEVIGRSSDVFVTSEGGIVVPEYFIHFIGVVLNTGWVLKYQAIQEDINHVHIKIVPASLIGDPLTHYRPQLEALTQMVKRVMGQNCMATYEFLVNIPPSPSGKYRYTISMVDRP